MAQNMTIKHTCNNSERHMYELDFRNEPHMTETLRPLPRDHITIIIEERPRRFHAQITYNLNHTCNASLGVDQAVWPAHIRSDPTRMEDCNSHFLRFQINRYTLDHGVQSAAAAIPIGRITGCRQETAAAAAKAATAITSPPPPPRSRSRRRLSTAAPRASSSTPPTCASGRICCRSASSTA